MMRKIGSHSASERLDNIKNKNKLKKEKFR